MAGPYKTLLQALGASSYLAGVSLAFGEEMLSAQDQPLPYVVMVPFGGPCSEPGYVRGLDPATDDVWQFTEATQFWCWAASTDPSAQQPVDHAEAARALRLLVCAALRDQKAMYSDANNIAFGLSHKVLGSEWKQMENAVSRFGRALVLSVQIDIPEVLPTPAEAQILTTQFTPTVVNGPS